MWQAITSVVDQQGTEEEHDTPEGLTALANRLANQRAYAERTILKLQRELWNLKNA